jgi:uncharacterized protein (DUF1800 family)
MKSVSRPLFVLVFFLSLISFLAFSPEPKHYDTLALPWKKAGLTERQAAAHLLNRFSFGARPGEVDEVVKMGLEKWMAAQLEGNLADKELDEKLAGYTALKLSNAQIVQTYPKPAYLLRQAIKDGVISKDSINTVKENKKDYRQQVKAYMDQKGYQPEAELFRQTINQKILRAVYANNQLEEVLTDFWFNHFNVSLTKGETKQFVMAYERDAIRPFVAGRFEDMLLATAHSPAMLTYLDNFRSVAANQDEGPMQKRMRQRMMKKLEQRQAADTTMQEYDVVEKVKAAKKAQGLNENYAREIMELHTLGVDGGYTQSDVTQAARILTGWTFKPMEEELKQATDKIINTVGEDRLRKRGFVQQGDFLFNANKHDKGEKTVLGVHFPAGGGYEEGVKLIHLLATHPSTAKFISKKLATRFVSDNPPQALIDKMAKTFLEKEGDIKAVLITMVNAPEFWSKEALREKTKSPFELAVSSIRSLDAEVYAPFPLYNWITKMGQKFYYYQAPTGFPDRGQYWINTGSLLNRMNFGLALASGRIPGVRVDLSALNQHREPESAEAALQVYTKLLMPERDVEATVKRLTPMLADPQLQKKVEEAAGRNSIAQKDEDDEGEEEMMSEKKREKLLEGKAPGKKNTGKRMEAVAYTQGDNSMLAQVVGIIIGSPEFQRK